MSPLQLVQTTVLYTSSKWRYAASLSPPPPTQTNPRWLYLILILHTYVAVGICRSISSTTVAHSHHHAIRRKGPIGLSSNSKLQFWTRSNLSKLRGGEQTSNNDDDFNNDDYEDYSLEEEGGGNNDTNDGGQIMDDVTSSLLDSDNILDQAGTENYAVDDNDESIEDNEDIDLLNQFYQGELSPKELFELEDRKQQSTNSDDFLDDDDDDNDEFLNDNTGSRNDNEGTSDRGMQNLDFDSPTSLTSSGSTTTNSNGDYNGGVSSGLEQDENYYPKYQKEQDVFESKQGQQQYLNKSPSLSSSSSSTKRSGERRKERNNVPSFLDPHYNRVLGDDDDYDDTNTRKKSSRSNFSGTSTTTTNYNNNDDNIINTFQSPSSSNNIVANVSPEIRKMASNLIHETSQTLSSVLNGKVAGFIPPDIYGESLEQEIAAWRLSSNTLSTTYASSSIHTNPDTVMSLQTSLSSFPDKQSAKQKLYGGAQYHRTLRSFHHRIHTIPIPLSSSNEISLLMEGVSSGQMHDGGDVLNTVSVLASKRMDEVAHLLLNEVAERVQYVLERMWTLIDYSALIRPNCGGGLNLSAYRRRVYGSFLDLEEGEDENEGLSFLYTGGSSIDAHVTRLEERKKKILSNRGGGDGSGGVGRKKRMTAKQYDQVEEELRDCVARAYEKFVQKKVECAYNMAKEDIYALLRFVSWDLAFSRMKRDTTSKNRSSGDLNMNRISGGAKGAEQRRKARVKASSTGPSKKIQKNSIIDDYDDDDDDIDDDEENEDMGDLVGGVLSSGNDALSTESPEKSEADDIFDTVVQAIQSCTSPQMSSAGGYAMDRMHVAINALVQQVTKSWRRDISQIIMGKFNAFCLLPLHQEFGAFLRTEMEQFLTERYDWA